MTSIDKSPNETQHDQLRTRLRQLILMRETGPKRAAWHEARARLIWRLHDEIRQADEAERQEATTAYGSTPDAK